MSGPGFIIPTWVCLGDSLTHEPPSSPTTILSSWPPRVDQAIYPGRAAANHGHTGTQVTADNVNGISMLNRFNNDIDGKGYYGMVFWGGINDFLFGVTAATLFSTWQGIVNRALAQGMKVIAVITHSPAGYTGGWSGTQQGYLDSFKASVLALQGTNPNLTIVNLYQAAPAGLDDPAAPTFLYGPYAGVANDGLHYGQAAQDQVILPTLIPLMQAATSVPFILGGSSRPVLSMKVGDRAPLLRAMLVDDAGNPVNLTGATVTFRMKSRSGGSLKVNAAASVVDAVNGVAQYTWAATDTDTAGYYRAEFGVSFGGPMETVPASGTMTVVLTPPLS